jgi:hypothetical protein
LKFEPDCVAQQNRSEVLTAHWQARIEATYACKATHVLTVVTVIPFTALHTNKRTNTQSKNAKKTRACPRSME